MNKNGYTLVELVATFTVLAIIMTIGIVSYNKISDSMKEKQLDTLKSEIKVASEKYYDETKMDTFTVKDLIDYGLLSPDNNGNIINPKDNSSLNLYYICPSDDFKLTSDGC